MYFFFYINEIEEIRDDNLKGLIWWKRRNW